MLHLSIKQVLAGKTDQGSEASHCDWLQLDDGNCIKAVDDNGPSDTVADPGFCKDFHTTSNSSDHCWFLF